MIMAVLTWNRFREVEKTTRVAMNTNNSIMAQRHHRVRRKLYLMSLSILIPFLPVQLLFLVYNVSAFGHPMKSYNYSQIHFGKNPYPFNFVSFTTSDRVGFIEMNVNYMSVITVIPLFWFFGATKEAINMYREYLLTVGLGRFFPKLHQEYDPDRTQTSNRSWGKRFSWLARNSGTGTR
jgi:pheromone a factor receptor